MRRNNYCYAASRPSTEPPRFGTTPWRFVFKAEQVTATARSGYWSTAKSSGRVKS